MYPFSKIEKKWQKIWLAEKTYEPDWKSASRRSKKPFYNLMMFPYPSAEGLHVGNMYAFTGTDIYGRFKRMQGNDVFEPIGLDGFGIHSENYAIKIGRHPAEQAKISQKNFYRQLQLIGNGFAWKEALATYDPAYYKWTQWIFTQMFKRGLAYRKKSPVNWCPSCKTVLADEQVINSKCERCSTEVINRDLEQWFFKITDYSERLLNNLDKIDWSEKVKIAQRNWIGRSEGALITFPLIDIPVQKNDKHSLEIFTTRPDTIFGATFMVISPERAKLWLDIGWQADKKVKKYVAGALARRSSAKRENTTEKTGIFSGVSAVNPGSREKIPVWISDYVLGNVGTGAIMAVPAHDERDFEFAHKFKLPIRVVVCPKEHNEACNEHERAYIGTGHLINSHKFNGMFSDHAKDAIVKQIGAKKQTQYRLRDWLISRQRYWGPPIPMIFCKACAGRGFGEREDMPGWYIVPEKNLPVKLPYVKNFRPTGTDQSPLASVESFYKVRCPKCKSWGKRETDVSDTFLDSAWYYLGYLILGNQKSKIPPRKGEARSIKLGGKNQKFIVDKALIKKWLPVNMYIGGAEHAVLHLLYVRFLAMFFKDMKLTNFEEPFHKFRAHGLIIKGGSKMSKSKGNVVNPDEYIKNFGADALRMYLMFLGPFEDGGDFSDSGVKGITRFLERVWVIGQTKKFAPKAEAKLDVLVNKTIKKVGDDLESLSYNTAISTLMILLNDFEKRSGAITKKQFESFLKLLAPFAPHITEELWSQLKNKKTIHKEKWPEYNEKLFKEDHFDLVIQVNGKFRAKVRASAGLTEKEAIALALKDQSVERYIRGKNITKIVFVLNRLINLVV